MAVEIPTATSNAQVRRRNAGLTLGLLVHHDDPEREYAYDDGAEQALQLARKEGWIVVSMKDDWKTVFAESPS